MISFAMIGMNTSIKQFNFVSQEQVRGWFLIAILTEITLFSVVRSLWRIWRQSFYRPWRTNIRKKPHEFKCPKLVHKGDEWYFWEVFTNFMNFRPVMNLLGAQTLNSSIAYSVKEYESICFIRGSKRIFWVFLAHLMNFKA